MIVTTGNEVAGHTVAAYIGIVCGGIVARQCPASHKASWAAWQKFVGGNIESYAEVLVNWPQTKHITGWCNMQRKRSGCGHRHARRCDRVLRERYDVLADGTACGEARPRLNSITGCPSLGLFRFWVRTP